MIPKNRPPEHPGEILDRIFLKELGLSQSDLAKHLKWKQSHRTIKVLKIGA
ncbi:MAG: hypothetical protein ABL927_09570 [Bdellovibrionales bacterium]